MGEPELQSLPQRKRFFLRGNRRLLAVFLLYWPQPCAALCREKPSVMLDEKTAATHLLSKKDPELPLHAQWRSSAEVVLRVTVDREGKICDVKPLAGPPELHRPAVRAVKSDWSYRPFLVDWKPVVAQFPVTVRFVPRRGDPKRLAARARFPASPLAPELAS